MRRAILLVLAAFFASAQEPPTLLDVAITGGYRIPPGTPRNENPFELLLTPQVQHLLLRMSGKSLAPSEMEDLLRGTDITPRNLLSAGLLRKTEHGYAIAFSLLTKKDQSRLALGIEPFAESLASALIADRIKLQELAARSPQHNHLSPGAMAFFVLGCVSLDWDGLSLITCEGYRATPQTTRFGKFLLWAIEIDESQPIVKLYDQSTSTTFKDATFTSFGVSPLTGHSRAAFPEVFRDLRAEFNNLEISKPQSKALRKALDAPTNAYFNQMGKLLLALRTSKSLKEAAVAAGQDGQTFEASLSMLESLHYIRRDAAKGTVEAIVPVLTMEDAPWLMELRTRAWLILKDWFAKNYKPLEAAFSDLSASRQGVPFPVVFDQVFHYLFGRANARIMASGLFVDVEAKDWPQLGFVAGVWDSRMKLGEDEESPCAALKR